ncbi:porin family protein [Flavobacterium branchiophilum]|uniref:PorT protein n=2 Tax=Flavobacterium branchiophilum TaxID=55197 RepID=G2Z4L5_FLABF|nr:porin family protein [Flavobacterium branchiophilum]PDS21761.1 PorT family protein [Flavobacterium branchiophilum]CCB68492.1 PorT protein [Flavobacterium branchiophilum FL-15]
MKNLFILLSLHFVLASQAQFRRSVFSKNPVLNFENWDKQRIYYGFYLGTNVYDYKIDYKSVVGRDVLIKSTAGFSVGIVGDLRLNEYFNLRFEPGLHYTQRDIYFTGFTKQTDYLREAKATNLNFPLLIKYSALRTGNIRPYLEAGFSQTLNLSSNQSVKDDNAQQIFRVKKMTTNYELGFGIDIYLEYFKFSPSVRGVFGLNDELIRDNDPNSPWTSNIQSMKTRAVFVTFTFH